MDDHFEQYYLKAVHFLKFRPRSTKEIRDHLLKKKASPDVIEKIVATLTEQKFLNDYDFARWWIESRARFRPKGRRIIELELKQKGIAKDTIEEVMEGEKSEDVPDEKEQLHRLIEQKLPKYKDLPRFEIYQKLGAFLARRGYDWDEIKRAIDSALSES
jgi:regulatory protein